jgi:ethanolamine-phosphate cytidylyltransferase
VKRTYGISTTDLVGKMLLKQRGYCTAEKEISASPSTYASYHNELLSLFRASLGRRREGTVVFIDGNFDLFHAGHTTALRLAKEMGDYLVVGIHGDEVTEEYSRNKPVMSLNERMLSLMSCKYVDEVICSPFIVDEGFVEQHRISKIRPSFDVKDLSRYDKVRNIVEHSYAENKFAYLSAEHIVNRIISNYMGYTLRQKKRLEKK